MRERGLFFVEEIDVIVIVFQMLEEVVDGRWSTERMRDMRCTIVYHVFDLCLLSHFIDRMRSRNKLWSA